MKWHLYPEHWRGKRLEMLLFASTFGSLYAYTAVLWSRFKPRFYKIRHNGNGNNVISHTSDLCESLVVRPNVYIVQYSKTYDHYMFFFRKINEYRRSNDRKQICVTEHCLFFLSNTLIVNPTTGNQSIFKLRVNRPHTYIYLYTNCILLIILEKIYIYLNNSSQ